MNYEIQVPERYLKEILIKNSDIHGSGLFTNIPIPQSTIFAEYRGKILSSEEAEKRDDQTYIFILNDSLCIDGDPHKYNNVAGYLNHSCNPNCECVFDWDGERVFFVALRDIMPGEELTYDYCFPDYGEKTPCTCGSSNCRGFLERP